MNILQNQILTGPVFKVEKLASSFVTEIWKSTRLTAAVKLGYISKLQISLKPTVLFTFQKDLD